MADGNQKKIVVVEDDLVMREIVTRKLKTNNFIVLEAVDGKKGLEITQAEKPDLVMLDLMLPELDGFGVLQAIRDDPDPQFARTPVIILSNLWSKEDILKAQNLKVDAYIVKAYVTTEEIFEKIKEILKNAPVAG